MLGEGTPIFVVFPEESDDRVLHPATVIEANGDARTAELEEEGLFPEAGQQIVIYFYDNVTGSHFLQCDAKIDAVMDTGDKPIIGFMTTGNTNSAESRQCFRVSTISNDLSAQVGPENDCRLLDVSQTGFSFITKTTYPTGAHINVVIRYEDTEYSGNMRVQGHRSMSRGRNRCGLHCTDDRRNGGNLKEGLQHITMAAQREQLRQMKRSG